VELAQIGPRGTIASWYDNADALWADAQPLLHTGNLFTTLNVIDRGALAEYVRENPRGRTPNHVVKRYARLFFDLDPVRPKGLSSTDDELDEAQRRARGLAARLSKIGWPTPAAGLSGNGFHVQYRVALPNTPETKEQLDVIYAGLASEFSDDVVDFDRTVRNPARLCCLYGTTKRKGPDTPDRPHRVARIELPQDWQQVSPRQVAQLADHFAHQRPAPQPVAAPRTAIGVGGQGDYRTLDVARWFAAHDAYVRPLVGNRHAVRCPWSGEHSTPSPRGGSDTIVMTTEGDGWAGFFCHHDHCAGRTIRDVLALWGDADGYCGATWGGGRHV
jgi:hypothetical protein